jgi:putative FmdB family regulatory protein
MPIYEYRCSACGHELESLQKFSDPALTTCPACHADKLTKLMSAAGFQLKGSGWYATDFRNGSKPAAKPAEKDGNGNEAAAAADSGDKSAAKSDTPKPEATKAETAKAAPKPEAAPKAASSDGKPSAGSGTSNP